MMAQAAVLRAHNRAQAKGSDPRVATCRGKLQNKRSKLNQEINKELRLRAGAENLFKATSNRKLKETVALELSFVNSNLQLLREQLAELNSSVELYQGESTEPVMPMIALGLKETKEIDFMEPFKDFILEHYSEDGAKYEKAIQEFMDLREAMRTPRRDASGVTLLLQYYNQLYFVERRFFPPDRSLGIYFEWFDSLTGVPSAQRSVAFEKACVLFNLSCLYTQLAAKQCRGTAKGLDKAVYYLTTTCDILKYLQDNFTSPPSAELTSPVLKLLGNIAAAQARECLLEKLQLQSKDKNDPDIFLDLAHEAQTVSSCYKQVDTMIKEVVDLLPPSWVSLCMLKTEHYAALACYFMSQALGPSSAGLEKLANRINGQTVLEYSKAEVAAVLRAAYLNRALGHHEESARIQRMCRELRTKRCLTAVVDRWKDAVHAKLSCTSKPSGHTGGEIMELPPIATKSKFELRPRTPDFGEVSVTDLFHDLGPLPVFSAKTRWSPPRSVQLQLSTDPAGACRERGYGFSLTTDSPAVVTNLRPGSIAQMSGMKEGDIIVSVNGVDVKWASHKQVVDLIRSCQDRLTLKIVTPSFPLHKGLPNGHGRSAKKVSLHEAALKKSQTQTSGNVENSAKKDAEKPTTQEQRKAGWSIFKKLEKSNSHNT
ncbi:GTP-Rho-binding protein rhophilin isoform X2 [Rhodnius prolixus]|uniref:GTP-Rho-binding protein rhophilin isoform X2 n=1 Tax=Rhodnius prolixus TaxID=13249 RepID=UPI003D18B031